MKVTGGYHPHHDAQCDFPPRDSTILFQHCVLFNNTNDLRVMSDAIFEASLHSNQIQSLFKVMLCLISFVTFVTFILHDAARVHILHKPLFEKHDFFVNGTECVFQSSAYPDLNSNVRFGKDSFF